jgi:hypothetical protein
MLGLRTIPREIQAYTQAWRLGIMIMFSP